MNKQTSVCLMLLSLNLGACSTLGSRPETVVMLGPELVEGIRQQVEVTQRLQKLEPSDTEYGGRQTALKAARDRVWQFERQSIAIAVRYEQKQQWREADQIYARALKYVPDSEILQAARKQMEERREAREQTLRAELSINQGEQLLKDERSYEQIAQLKPSSLLTRLEISAYERKRRKVSDQLLTQGKLAIERRDYSLARRCLAIAQRLEPTDEVGDALQLADARLNKTGRVIPLPSRMRESSLHARIEQYQQTLEKGDLSLARRQLTQLQQQFPDNADLQTLDAQLRILIEAKVVAASQHAKVLYSEGNVQQALALWQEILPLDPDNPDLQLNISRAQRVLENLRALREKQSG